MKKIASLACLALGMMVSPVLADDGAYDHLAKKWLVRGRVIGVVPEESSTIHTIGGEASINTQVVPELDFSYFFTDNIAAELILATTRHNATAKGTMIGDLEAGSVWVLPPTLTLQYHFTQLEGLKPYVGAGINYTMYYNEKGADAGRFKVKDSFGYALQAGVDIPVDDRWAINFDVKKLFVKADSKWPSVGVKADIDLDPWIVGTGLTYRLN